MFKVEQRVWHTQHRCFYKLIEEDYEIIGAFRAIRENDNKNTYSIDSDYLHQTAQTMFEALGYEYVVDTKNKRITYKYRNSLEIIFSLIDKEVWLERLDDTSGEYILEIPVHLAIHQKMIEEGYIK